MRNIIYMIFHMSIVVLVTLKILEIGKDEKGRNE